MSTRRLLMSGAAMLVVAAVAAAAGTDSTSAFDDRGGPFCGGAVLPDLPPWSWVSAPATTELPEAPPWCDGACVIDIAFIYADDAVGLTRADYFGNGNPNARYGRHETVGGLLATVHHAADVATVAFRRAHLDARLRVVGVQRDSALNGMDIDVAILYTRTRAAGLRHEVGADLVFAIVRDSASSCGLAYLRSPGESAASAATSAVGALSSRCLDEGPWLLAHEVGHNLGLTHDLEARLFGGRVYTPYVPFGRGYRHSSTPESGSPVSEQSIMSTQGPNVGAWFSTTESVRGLVLGNADESNAARALRYTIPDAANYVPARFATDENEPPLGCRNRTSNTCLQDWRFRVEAKANDRPDFAGPLDVFGLGDDAALFYFYSADNPELLVKVLDACSYNGHWWVYGSAATDQPYFIRIGDLAPGGETIIYRHSGGTVTGYFERYEEPSDEFPGGRIYEAPTGYATVTGVITDTGAFRCER